MSATILNTDSNINAKTVMAAENAETVTGLKTFDRDPNPPFAVSSGSAVVPNLDADKLDGLDSLAFVKADGTVAMSGALTQNAGQIVFPAVQLASAGANTLDDYEEGTWVPVLGGSGGTSGQTYSIQVGFYVKIGQLVLAYGTVVLTAKGTITTSLQIQGLPFTTLATANSYSTGAISAFSNLASNMSSLSLRADPSTTAATVFGIGAAGPSQAALTTADVANNTALSFVMMYRASA